MPHNINQESTIEILPNITKDEQIAILLAIIDKLQRKIGVMEKNCQDLSRCYRALLSLTKSEQSNTVHQKMMLLAKSTVDHYQTKYLTEIEHDYA